MKHLILGSRNHLALAILLLALSACVSVENLPTPTPTSTEPPPTPTFFFPTLIPTATMTPPPSPTATPDIISGLDTVLFQDRFATQTGWETLETRVGGVSYLNGRFSLAVNEPYTFFSAISPAPVFTDGYIEVQARAILCSEGDTYGLTFRVTPEGDHYRYTLSCDGNVRISRISAGEELVLVADTPTNSVLSGLLVDNRMAVILTGDEFKFFLNGVEVLTEQDDALPAGRAGLIVRARAGGQTTVSFDNYIVRSLKPTPTATATPSALQP
ncbi:MAG: hypothetical protein PVI81_06910 [Anaerolineales bacterium]